MKKDVVRKLLTIVVINIFIFTSTSVIAEKSLDCIIENDKSLINQYLNENIDNNELINKFTNVLNNSTGRYLIFTTGIRASSYFVKLPRLLTQRGFIFSGEIWYRSNFAITIVLQKNNSRFKLVNFERGTHRVFVFGIGHSTFTKPHVFSFGRVVAFTKIKPILF